MKQSNRLCYEVGMQISHSLDSKASLENFVWKIEGYLGEVFYKLASERGCRIVEGTYVQAMFICIEIPPKYSVSQIVEYSKGKSAIHIAREVERRGRNLWDKTSRHEATLYPPLVAMR